MLTNPFTPIFGGKPDFFFGRKEILRRFDGAMSDRGSDYRAVFFTGTRGYGKTSVLEQLSQRANRAGWRVVDIGSDKPVETIVRRLAGASEATKTVDPSVSVSVFGTGAAASGVSSSKTMRYEREDLGLLVLDTCEREKHGLLITVDEVQKIDLDDVAAICDAFQMASRKGHDAMLAVAGLPYAHSKVIHHEGCTYLRRAVHEVLTPLSPDEVHTAFEDALALAGGVRIGDGALDVLVASSKGHPYIMQLLGFYLIDALRSNAGTKRLDVSEEDAEKAIARAKETYALRAVRPVIDAMGGAEVSYLRAMAHVIGPDRTAKTGDIARFLGKTQQQTSRARQRLIDNGIILAAGHGAVVYGIPYLDDYLLAKSDRQTELESREAWRY